MHRIEFDTTEAERVARTSDGLKHLARYRHHLVVERAALKSRCTGVMSQVFPEFGTVFKKMYCEAAKALLKHYPTPVGIASVDVSTLMALIMKASNGHLGADRAEEIRAVARESAGAPLATPALAFEISHMVETIDHLDRQIERLEAEISRMLAETPGCWLVTIDGVGDTLAAVIAGEIGDASRFGGPKKLIAFAGIYPIRGEAGGPAARENRMSKKGSPYLRYALLTAADKVRQRDPYFGDYYKTKIAEGKPHYVALSCVARKLAGVCLVLMKEQRAYEPRPSIQPAKREPGD